MRPVSLAALLPMPWPGIFQGPLPKLALYPAGNAGITSGEIACHDRTLRPASLGGDVHHPERPSAVQALPTM